MAVVNRVNPTIIEGIITAEDVMEAFGVRGDVHEEGDVADPVEPPAPQPVSSPPKGV